MSRWKNIRKHKPPIGVTIEVMHSFSGIRAAVAGPGQAYTGKARYREVPEHIKKSKKYHEFMHWVFVQIKHEPGYDILNGGGLAPTHWREICQ